MIGIRRAFNAYLDELDFITILLPYSHFAGHADSFSLWIHGQKITDLPIKNVIPLKDFKKFECELPIHPEFGVSYEVYDSNGGMTDLQIGAVIRTTKFDELFYYSGEDLGVTFSEGKSSFKIWSPTATKVKLKLIDPNGLELPNVECTRGEKGIWSVKQEGNLDGYLYSYLICVNLVWKEAVDPYAVAVSTNGEMGVIVDLQKTYVDFPVLPPLPSTLDSIIYEAHIRDVSIHLDSGINDKGKYLGLTEVGTRTSLGNPTGLDYIRNLGITHLELLPFNDFGGVDEKNPTTQYNWGYNPIHFNAPEGSYSTNPSNPYSRIRELKQMIAAIQHKGIRVIMDVVYNHVYVRETSNLEHIVPGYYFRHDTHGMPSNGTGVGNDIASERLMVRKFITDSIKFWMKEYNVNGFRFDLMGILDVETMNEVRQLVDTIDHEALILGEGWDLNTPIPSEKKASLKNAKMMPRIAQFNDWFRDSIKGSTFNLHDRGFIHGNTHKIESVKRSILGSVDFNGKSGLFQFPSQSINYVESHDNHTLWDRIHLNNPTELDEVKRKRHSLATSLVLLSQGIPFLHAGQEFFRTKKGVENSYKSPDTINQLDWLRNADYQDHVDYIKGLISIRKAHGAFRFPSAPLIQKHVSIQQGPGTTILYLLNEVKEYGPWRNILVCYNPQIESIEIQLPIKGKWKVICEKGKSGVKTLCEKDSSSTKIDPLSVSIFVQD
ncbi:type I pullulanase [Peribacillus alkalitolerans]|uniref:type I pullulanase n=1 Tax=Peribacillus alkalitolerans TaxID=1550385 RepID=UPI0013D2FAEE|nr:type I pullulanase [Peribacillus alkalitolerans]